MREYGKSRFFAIVVAHFNFSCTLLATFRAQILKKAKLEETTMKIAARLLVLTLVLSAVGFSQSSFFAGPGVPIPPAQGR